MILKANTNITSETDFLEGQVLLFNKPIGWSSFDVVKKARNIIKSAKNIRKIKVGHAGTLDPLADGLLIVCSGRFTKRIDEIQGQIKVYTSICLHCTFHKKRFTIFITTQYNSNCCITKQS